MIQTLALLSILGGPLDQPSAIGPDRSLLNDGGQEVAATDAFDGWHRGNGAFVPESDRFGGREPADGEWFWRLRSGAEFGELRQRIELDAFGGGAPTHVCLSALIAVPDGQDRAGLRLVFEGRKGELISQTAIDSREKSWTETSLFAAVPDTAVAVTAILVAERRRGDFCDAFFDRVLLEAIGGGWPRQRGADQDFQAMLTGGDAVQRSLAARTLATGDRAEQQQLADHIASIPFGRERDRLVGFLVAGADPEIASERLAAEFANEDQRAAAARLCGLRVLDGLDANALFEGFEDAKSAEDAGVFAEAVCRMVALGGKPSKAAERAIYRWLKSDPTRRRILEALARLEVAELDGAKNLGSMVADFTDPKKEDREGEAALALEALASLSSKQFLTVLKKRLSDFDSPSPRQRLFQRAVELQSGDAAELLLDLVDGASRPLERAFTATAFGDSAHGFRSRQALSVLRSRGLEHESPVVRLASIEAFAATGSLDALVEAAGDGDVLCAVTAVEGMRFLREGGPVLPTGPLGPVESALRLLLEDASPFAAGTALAVLSSEGGEAAQWFRLWHRDPRAPVRVAALAALDGASVVTLRDEVLAAFEDRSRPVRVAAYRALGRSKQSPNVEALIERMASETGTASDDLRRVLVAMTGTDRGSEASNWRRWWDLVGDGFDFEQAARSKPDAAPEDRTVTAYHGIPIVADRFAFVIDLSGSMREKAGDVTRLERARTELTAVLRSLRPDQHFALIGFGTDVHPFSDDLVEATPKNVDEAVKWIANLETRGWTNLFDGLERALLLDSVEAVYLLSDGGPSVGRLVDLDRILRIVGQVNASLFVRIHAVVIDGSDRARWFLDRLSEQTGGRSVPG